MPFPSSPMTAANTEPVQTGQVQGQGRASAAMFAKKKKKKPVEPEAPAGPPQPPVKASAAMLTKRGR